MSADKQPTPPVESPTAAWLAGVPEARSLAEVGEPTAGLTGTPGAIDSAVVVPPELAHHPRYRVLALLGEGGMGAVYKAQHTHMDRLVALKVIRPALVKHPASLKRFEQEVRAAARLTHANIVTAYDADRAGSLHFLIMEFVEGQSLADYLHGRDRSHWPRRAPMPAKPLSVCNTPTRRAWCIATSSLTISCCTPRGEVKILDFGLAPWGSRGRPSPS